MPIEVDLIGLEKNYREMSDEEFALVRRADLTAEAAAVYDRVAALRSGSEWCVTHPRREVRPINLNSPRHLKMANYLNYIAGYAIGCSILFGAISAFFVFGDPHPAVGVVPGIFAMLSLATGIGLLRTSRWARIVAIVWAVGLILAPWSWGILWVLTRRETKDLFGVPLRPGDLDYLVDEDQ